MQEVNVKILYRNKRVAYQLNEPLTIRSMTIPEGFISDGHSVPWFLRWIVSNHSLPLDAAFYHDYGYMENPLKLSRAKVDKEYRNILRIDFKAPWYLAYAAWIGVRLGSWFWWNKSNRGNK